MNIIFQIYILHPVCLQDDPSAQVSDIRKSWMRKIIGFTVHQPSERLVPQLTPKLSLYSYFSPL